MLAISLTLCHYMIFHWASFVSLGCKDTTTYLHYSKRSRERERVVQHNMQSLKGPAAILFQLFERIG
ncbi:hypothetical protein EUGRSUZ_E02227 [Eucalyptus grandis]|uniref:Uncharacterized protein n=2 Tax=Eucalyptus grandis TaxID=71139 RepID=A0ACC3KY66_EUCGR|nr:hypothetical protein EUGRSUZ_E02227 [Eucalyptus grandis]